MNAMDTKRLTRLALLTAVALAIFVVESQIPPLVPIPGFKLGLANIITVYAMFACGAKDTARILGARILLGNLLVGQFMNFLFSLCGGGACYLTMLLLYRVLTRNQIWICSVLSAIAHVIGQMIVAVCVVGSGTVLLYLPYLLAGAVMTGLFTGLCAQYLVNRIKK